MAIKPFLIAGLGNRGSEYDGTRHNAGFLVIDELARRWQVELDREKWHSLFGRVQLSGNTVLFLKPMTFMNLSGKGVVEFVRFYKVDFSRILVIHDDLDMGPGRIKLVRGGGSGGHNGIKSLVDCLGSKDFSRLKVGIGRPGLNGVHRSFPVEKYVLGHLADDELQLLVSRYDFIEKGVRLFIEGDSAGAMSVINRLK
ncbi:MAG: aminoacyl-tRNA hydrolase [Deltaproteobacteria bacterium]|nr:aminoacyl-tRNA hydrolase [Deltaproteobacteria bacterium]